MLPDFTTDAASTSDLRFTAGGRLVFQYVKKQASHPKCGATGVRLNGVSFPLALESPSQ